MQAQAQATRVPSSELGGGVFLVARAACTTSPQLGAHLPTFFWGRVPLLK